MFFWGACSGAFDHATQFSSALWVSCRCLDVSWLWASIRLLPSPLKSRAWPRKTAKRSQLKVHLLSYISISNSPMNRMYCFMNVYCCCVTLVGIFCDFLWSACFRHVQDVMYNMYKAKQCVATYYRERLKLAALNRRPWLRVGLLCSRLLFRVLRFTFLRWMNV